jgi:two-component system, chemotaxis family, chemotaxis protein CheY
MTTQMTVVAAGAQRVRWQELADYSVAHQSQPRLLPHRPQPRHVLVVDDDAGIRSVVADAFEMEGYQVVTARNGAEALERVRASRPDAIVVDLMMPIMDGWQFLEACRKDGLCEGTPVVVMSAYRFLAEISSDLGASACIAKPFDLDVLLGAVERLIHARA